MLSAARTAAGPFSSAINTSAMTNVYASYGGFDGCKVTITAPFTPLGGLIPVGPSSVTVAFTAYAINS